MRDATPTTKPITKFAGKSVAAVGAATLRNSANRMSQCYIAPNSAEINRQPRRLEITVSHTKQTSATQFNRQLFATLQNASQRANSSHSFILSAFCEGPLTTSHCLFRQEARVTPSGSTCSVHRLAASFSKPRNLSSLITDHSPLASSRRTCASAKKQQIRRSRSNPLGLYFLASYAHFPIGTQRALMHNGGTAVTAGFNDKKIHAAELGLEPSREHQSVIR